MRKLLLILFLLITASASADTAGTNYKLRSNLKKDLTITGSLPMRNDLDMGGNDIIDVGDMTITGTLTVDSVDAKSLTASDLTETRVVYVGTGGLLIDDAGFTFSLDTLFAPNVTSTGTITGGTLTDGTASLTGGVGTGYTLASPVVSGNFSWADGSATWDLGSGPKFLKISNNAGLIFEDEDFNQWMLYSPQFNTIDFGNATDNPTFGFLGSGLATFGENLTIDGAGGFIGDTVDGELIEIDGAGGEVTVDGDFIADTGRFDGGVGVGCDPSGNGICIAGTRTTTFNGIQSTVTVDASVASQSFNSLDFLAEVVSGSEDITQMNGATGIVQSFGFTGNISTVRGLAVGIVHFAPGTITDAVAFDIPTWLINFGGTVTNGYGLRMPAITGATNNWSIFSEGGNMAHVGNVRIGDTTAPTYALEVAGVVKSESGRIKNTTRVTTTYQILVTDDQVFCNTDGSAWIATLPVGVDGQSFRLINTGDQGNQLTIAVQSGEDLLGVTNDTFILNDGEVLILTFETTEGWY
jgi:hypothetical protein